MYETEKYDNIHTADLYLRRLVRVKYFLPLVALIMLSTLSFFVEKEDPFKTAQLSPEERQRLSLGQQITQPSFSGLTDFGTSVAVSAKFAFVNVNNQYKLRIEETRIFVETLLQEWVKANSAYAIIETQAGKIELSKDVKIETSYGYRIMAQKADISYKNSFEIELTNPIGESDNLDFFKADKGRIYESESHLYGKYKVEFIGNVQLSYTPQ